MSDDSRPTLKTLSVCSGIGAPEASGQFEPVGLCEIAEKPRLILRRHFPGVPLHSDLVDRSWWPDYRGVDCLIGGTPCQSFSIAGNRRGLDDERGNLMLSFLDLADTIRPLSVVWENVPGVMFRKTRPAFDLLIGELRRMGYVVEDCILNAQYFGVPQHRRRVFVVASPNGIDLADALAVRVRSSVADILEADPDPKYNVSQKAAAGVLRRRAKFKSRALPPVLQSALEAVAEGRELGAGELHLPTMSNGDDAVPAIPASGAGYMRTSARSWNGDPVLITPAITPTLTARAHGVKDNSIHARSTPPYLVTSDEPDIAMTLTATNAGRITSHYGRDNIIAQNRRLRRFTPTECERLMGFPDGWTAEDDRGRLLKDTPRYTMLGNSMAVPVVGWIGERIREVLR